MDTQQQTSYNILLIGDNCLDIYQYGTIDRISPEAPVPVFTFKYEEQRPGMAHNVMKNFDALGCGITFYTDDKTSTKTRLIDQRSKQHIVRIDNDVTADPVPIEFIEKEKLLEYDAVVISDYCKGAVEYNLIKWLRQEFAGPIFVDTKKHDLAQIDGCFVKVNELEYSRMTSLPSQEYLIVTRGDKGVTWNGNTYSAESVEVADVCGAGDTFLAALAYQFLTTKDIDSSIKFAIRASAVTVQHIGVYSPTIEEITGN